MTLKIILTNDDGINAPGLQALIWCLQDFCETVVIAPEGPQSGIAHQVTVRSPIRVNEIAKNRFGVAGTPADCSRLALKQIVPDAEWVVSGINPGANLGSDVYNSGTVAAAREAAILGCRAIAISQYIAKDHQVNWEVTRHHAKPVLQMLLQQHLEPGFFWNVNLPHPLEYNFDLRYEFCALDTNPHKYIYRKEKDGYIYDGTIHERPRDAGKDVDVCFGGKISITRLSLDTASIN